jgi:hypothetical protein
VGESFSLGRIAGIRIGINGSRLPSITDVMPAIQVVPPQRRAA